MRIGYDFAGFMPGAEHDAPQFIERNGFGAADLDGAVERRPDAASTPSGKS